MSGSNLLGKHIVHKPLERRWGICKSELHDCGFKLSKGANEGRLVFISSPDLDIMESPSDVKFREDTTFREAVQYFSDERQRVGVLHSDLIQFPTVNDGPEFVSFILEEQRCCIWGVTRMNTT